MICDPDIVPASTIHHQRLSALAAALSALTADGIQATVRVSATPATAATSAAEAKELARLALFRAMECEANRITNDVLARLPLK